jgi:predicted MFS family arabinose efflux permease
MKRLWNVIEGAAKGGVWGIIAGVAAAALSSCYAQYQDSSNAGGGGAIVILTIPAGIILGIPLGAIAGMRKNWRDSSAKKKSNPTR